MSKTIEIANELRKGKKLPPAAMQLGRQASSDLLDKDAPEGYAPRSVRFMECTRKVKQQATAMPAPKPQTSVTTAKPTPPKRTPRETITA